MKRQLAFVLGGGGARGALQVGALQALLEAGYHPDICVGTSVGAVNSTFLALHGFTPEGLNALSGAWHDAMRADLLPANYVWLTVRSLFGRLSTHPAQHIRNFYMAHGLTPDLRFENVRNCRLILVATDLNSGQPVLYGLNDDDSVLEGLVASTALPPWVRPLEKDGKFILDGGLVSNLPIESALNVGASEIIALDLLDSRESPLGAHGFGPFFNKLYCTIEQRQQDLEKALALTKRVSVTHIHLLGEEYTPLWDFQHTKELIQQGYIITQKVLDNMEPVSTLDKLRGWWWRRKV